MSGNLAHMTKLMARLREAIATERDQCVCNDRSEGVIACQVGTDAELSVFRVALERVCKIADNTYDGGCWFCCGDAVGVIAGKKACADCLEAFEGVDPADLGV